MSSDDEAHAALRAAVVGTMSDHFQATWQSDRCAPRPGYYFGDLADAIVAAVVAALPVPADLVGPAQLDEDTT